MTERELALARRHNDMALRAVHIAALSAAMLLEMFPPDRAPVATTNFGASIAIAAGLGRHTGWAVWAVSVLVLLWKTPPVGSLWVDPEYAPFVVYVTLGWLTILLQPRLPKSKITSNGNQP